MCRICPCTVLPHRAPCCVSIHTSSLAGFSFTSQYRSCCLHWAAQRYVLHLTVVWSLASHCWPQGVSWLDSDPSVLCSQQGFPLQVWIFWQETIQNVQNTRCQAECVTLNDDLLYECACCFVSYLFKEQPLQKSWCNLRSITIKVLGIPAVRKTPLPFSIYR